MSSTRESDEARWGQANGVPMPIPAKVRRPEASSLSPGSTLGVAEQGLEGDSSGCSGATTRTSCGPGKPIRRGGPPHAAEDCTASADPTHRAVPRAAAIAPGGPGACYRTCRAAASSARSKIVNPGEVRGFTAVATGLRLPRSGRADATRENDERNQDASDRRARRSYLDRCSSGSRPWDHRWLPVSARKTWRERS